MTSLTPRPKQVNKALTRITPPKWVRTGLAALFGTLAKVRRNRAIHTRGITRSGTAHMHDHGLALSTQPTTDVIVRFSRGAGLPARLPDINGLAIRFMINDGHRDLLLATAGPGRFRRILTPAIDFATNRYSTIASYQLHNKPAVITAELVGDHITLDELATPHPRLLHLTAHRDDRPHHLGTIELGAPIDGSHVRYDPNATGPDLTPLGPINALRPSAYAASQQQPAK